MSLYSSCLVDGRYLVDFYLPHPSDFRFNAINKRFWLQYHSHDDILGPTTSAYTHYIRPSNTSEAYANRQKLLPYCKYVNLTHSDTYIHGPFDFATINLQKSRDRIPQGAWDILKSNTPMFHNPIPRFDVPTNSIHVDRDAHTSSHCATHACELVQSAKRALHNPGQHLYP
jgi:hypothetical protein